MDVHGDWSTQGVSLLPLGRRFAAVRMSEALVRAGVGCEGSVRIATVLEKALYGPVIQDCRAVGITFYALTIWDDDTESVRFDDEDAQCLGPGVYLGVPRIDRREPPGSHWAVPPRYEGDLCAPEAVAALVESGRRRLQSAEAPDPPLVVRPRLASLPVPGRDVRP
ncbi:hypothetical protein [Streptomyces minutiscleroticus]|uniref:hypothetical protein n=1 Tax=Streptomyces minutiscleroticus TaxID=68238 RepID=UPI00331E938C